LKQFLSGVEAIPATTSWYLADLGEARGKQELFTKQSPQTLKALREHALIESAVSSNRIEGVVADQARVGTIVFGHKQLRDRAEEEIRGYRDALKRIHERGAQLPISEGTIRDLHSSTRGGVGDAGQYKEKDSDIILGAIRNQRGEFRLADIERACPGVGREWIRKLLADLKSSGEVSCRGKGLAARWRDEKTKGSNPG
jgi:Fic family protein